MEKISIIILNFNGTKDTLECLYSICQLSIVNCQLSVVVVDNGSEDKFKIQNSKFKIEELKIIRNDQNLGFSGGNNVGIRYALKSGADYILILNNDTIVDKNIIRELVKVADLEERIGIIVPKIYFAKGHEFHKDRYKQDEQGKVIWYAGGIMDWNNVMGSHRGVDEVDSGQFDKIEPTEFASGCCMFVKREVFERVGLLDTKYFLYYEDSDLSERVKKVGYKIMYAPLAFLWHINAGSAGGSGSKLQDYYISRNRLLFGMRYASLKTKLALIRESISLLAKGRSWQKKGVVDFYLRRFGKGTYIYDK